MRRITDHVPVSNLITGRFKTGTDYTNWRPRGTRDWLLIATTRGSGLYEASDRRSFRSEACILTLYAPGVVQDYRTDTNARRWDLVWAHFVPRPHWTPLLAWPEVLPGLMAMDMRSARASTDWLALVRELSAMDAVRHGGGSRSVDWSMNFLERALLIASRHVPDLSRSRQDRRIESVKARVADLA